MASTTLPNGTSPPGQMPLVETPYLIVGAGPAGAALACFLASHGLTGIIISAASGTAKEPRAHITNPAAQECLRDIGLEEAVLEEGTDQVNMSHTRWCHDMAGDEWARIHSWGCQPDRQGEYAAASPCKHVDCPQTILEPILINRARNGGWKVRFDSAFVEFARDGLEGPITSTIQDTLTGHKYQIRSKYLFGCDGGRSQVIRQLAIPLKKEPGQGLAINVHARMDLNKFMKHKEGVLHWTFQPEIDHPPWAWSVIVRMVEPWNEWMFIVLPEPGFTDFTVKPTHEECMKRMRQCVGDDSVDIEILDVAKWYINEIVAERYSDGNIFCLGDAVHRVRISRILLEDKLLTNASAAPAFQRPRQQHLRTRRLQPSLEDRLRRQRLRGPEPTLNIQRRASTDRRGSHQTREPRPARPRPSLRSTRRLSGSAQRRAYAPAC
jgi:2-polyprenyl-6-methoxyphenol hydroxylase-like FAD-dependent oxidoreductase